jgi:hypothetical protein
MAISNSLERATQVRRTTVQSRTTCSPLPSSLGVLFGQPNFGLKQDTYAPVTVVLLRVYGWQGGDISQSEAPRDSSWAGRRCWMDEATGGGSPGWLW